METDQKTGRCRRKRTQYKPAWYFYRYCWYCFLFLVSKYSYNFKTSFQKILTVHFLPVPLAYVFFLLPLSHAGLSWCFFYELIESSFPLFSSVFFFVCVFRIGKRKGVFRLLKRKTTKSISQESYKPTLNLSIRTDRTTFSLQQLSMEQPDKNWLSAQLSTRPSNTVVSGFY